MNVIMHKSHDNDSVQGAYCSVCVCVIIPLLLVIVLLPVNVSYDVIYEHCNCT